MLKVVSGKILIVETIEEKKAHHRKFGVKSIMMIVVVRNTHCGTKMEPMIMY